MAVQLSGTQGQVFGPSGSNHSQGLVPDPGTVSGSNRVLFENSTFATIAYSQISGTPTIPTVGVPSFVILNSLSANNSASLTDTTSLTTVYTNYGIFFDNILPSSNSVTLMAQVSTNGGTTYLNSSYQSSSATPSTINTSTTVILVSSNTALGISNAAGYGLSGQLWLYNPSAGANRTQINGTASWRIPGTGGVSFSQFGAFQDGGNSAINAIKFFMSGGNIASGTIQIYGMS
jgi:hypothetical protein